MPQDACQISVNHFRHSGAHGVDGHSEKVNLIWSVADLLRGTYKASDYSKVILPFVVLRCLDCLLFPKLHRLEQKYRTFIG